MVSGPARPTSSDLAEAAALLWEVLALVVAAELEASTPRAVSMVRRLEGAAVSLEAAAGWGLIRAGAAPKRRFPLR